MIEDTTKRYHPGKIPIPDTIWIVETIKDNKFIYIGNVFVPGELVSSEMDRHFSIKGYEPYNIAKRLAHEKYPEANPIIIHLKEARDREKSKLYRQ